MKNHNRSCIHSFRSINQHYCTCTPDEQKLEKQMYDLKQELDDLKNQKFLISSLAGESRQISTTFKALTMPARLAIQAVIFPSPHSYLCRECAW